ncbi:MAG: family 2A encapsulin nanocompartment cargo protein cysteine desulfurase [Polyangiaceae bacterium]
MTTSDPNGLAGALGREIEALANQFFKGAPASPSNGVVAPNAAGISAPSFTQNGPPMPGAMHTPPLAAAPMPKESDLRNAPALFAEPLGTTPLALHLAREPGNLGGDGSVPYFLALAGSPAAPAGAMPTGSAMPPTSQSTVPVSGAAPVPTGSAVPAGAASPSTTYAYSPTFEALGAPSTSDDMSGVARSSRSRPLEPNVVKRDFPILRERVHGKPLVWLDSAATTQKPQCVIDRISSFYEHENSNVHRAAHAMAARATDAYEAARDKVREFLNAPSAQNIVFARGTTEAINLVAQSWGRRNVHEGDEIVITWLEHHANIVPWQQLCRERGAKLRVAPVDSRGDVILEEYEKLLGPKTRIVSMTQVSNALGTIVPVREMTAMAKRHGACVLIDGAQAVSHMPVDVQALGPDFYVFSGHKVFAPTGIGVLYGKSDVLEAMPPWQGGGNMIADVTFERTLYQPPPGRFEAGTGNIADAVGLGAAIDYVRELGMENISRYEHELLHYAEGELARVPGLHMVGAPREKAGVLSFVLDGHRSEDVGSALDQDGIAVRSGHHCAQPILRRFGHESTVRASLAPYNTREDIDALVRTLCRLQANHPHGR